MPTLRSSSSLAFSVHPGEMFVKPTKSPTLDNGFVSRRLPAPCSCSIARILHGMLVPNVVTLGSADAEAALAGKQIQMTLNAPGGKRLIEVTLAPGEILSFDLAYLIAFSKELRLWTDIDFSMSSFGANRNFIQNAQGPGVLVFELNGEETKNSEHKFHFAPSRLVAWTPSLQFTFCGIGSVWDVYLNEIMVLTTPAAQGSTILLDADAESSGVPGGVRSLFKLLKRVYNPL